MSEHVDHARALSPRRRAALRLDLDDRQAALIRDLYVMASELDDTDPCEATVPEAWRLRPGPGGVSLPRLRRGLTDLYRINRALVRLDHDGYGLCRCCGRPIDFDRLSEDPLRERCDGCTAGAVSG